MSFVRWPPAYPAVVESLRSGPWPDLPLKPDSVHLGIPIGRAINLGDIFAKPLDKALGVSLPTVTSFAGSRCPIVYSTSTRL